MSENNGTPQGILVQESNSVPNNFKYVEYKCGFTNREGVKSCKWTTGMIGRATAIKMMGEHWNYEHEDEHKRIQLENKLERERELNEKVAAIKKKHMKNS